MFRAYFSVKETLVLSFVDIFFLIRGFLDHENVILLKSKNFDIFKGIIPWFSSKVLNIFSDCLSVKETLVLTLNDDFFFQKVAF